MPEGDTIFLTAHNLRRALLNRTLLRFESSIQSVADDARNHSIVGKVIAAVEPVGKHLLILFRSASDNTDPEPAPPAIPVEMFRTDILLHSHMQMTGSWHIYRPDEPWRKPTRYARAVLHTDAFVIPCFSAPVVELLTARQTARHPHLAPLGPDAITPEFDIADALTRLRAHPDLPIGVALMNQRTLAGVGNIYKSEILFIQRISPFVCVRLLCDEHLIGILECAHNLLRANRLTSNRRTTHSLRPDQRLWVYHRHDSGCRICGTTILMQRQGLDGRSTYYCPLCQDCKQDGPAARFT